MNLAMLQALSTIAQALAVVVGVLIACMTFRFVHRRTTELDWFERFHALYAEFWNDQQLENVRGWLSSETQYQRIKQILVKRLAASENTLDDSDNKILELIDKFCAMMLRVNAFKQVDMTKRQRLLFAGLFEYWDEMIEKRSELLAYTKIYWPHLFSLRNKGKF